MTKKQKQIKWTKEQARAIKLSYQHWLRLAFGIQKPGEGIRGEHCALCQMCRVSLTREDCSICPIVLAGHTRCSLLGSMWRSGTRREMAAFLAKLYRMGV